MSGWQALPYILGTPPEYPRRCAWERRAGGRGARAERHLHWTTAMCETAVRNADVRRSDAARAEVRGAKAVNEAWWAACKTKVGCYCWVLVIVAVATFLCVLPSYLDHGCGACENDAACDGLFGECVCTGNHLGEYCEDSCGDFGRVSGSACVCSGNYQGAFCELDALGQLVDDRDDSTGLGAGWIVLIVLGTCCFCVTCVPCALYEFFDDGGDCRPRFWEDCGFCHGRSRR